jgi:hypothetical protein
MARVPRTAVVRLALEVLRHGTVLGGGLAVLGLAGSAMSCDRNPARPSISNLTQVMSLEVTGPDSIAVGESAQFRATAHMKNGSSVDVTGDAQWRSYEPSVVSMSLAGLATAVAGGEAIVGASYLGRQDNSTVVQVLEPGVYPELSGSFRLTITAGSCQPTNRPLPKVAETRTYDAEITQSGQSLHVTLRQLAGTSTSGGFLAGSSGFDGIRYPNRVTFQMFGVDAATNYYYYYPDLSPSLVERVSSWWLVVSGRVLAVIDHTRIAGLLDGELTIYDGSLPVPGGEALGGCRASDHRFVMERE